MPRSAAPARLRRQRARATAGIAGIATLSLALPGLAAHADPVAGASTYTAALMVGAAEAPPGTRVVLTHHQDGAWIWTEDGPQTETSIDGRFSLGLLGAGTYRVGLFDPARRTAELSDGTTVPVGTLAASLADLDVSLPAADASSGVPINGTDPSGGATVWIPAPLTASTLSGVVVDDDGATGQSGATVALYVYDPVSDSTEVARDAGEDPLTTTTGSGGAYTFPDLPAGYYVTHVTYQEDSAGFDPAFSEGLAAGGTWLDGAAARTTATLTLADTEPPYVPPYVPPVVYPTPSTSPSPSVAPSPTAGPSVPAKPSPSATTPPSPAVIGTAPLPQVIPPNLPAHPTEAILPQISRGAIDALHLPPPVPQDQHALLDALSQEMAAAFQQAKENGNATPTPPTVQPNVLTGGPGGLAPSLAPGLYVQVLDGLISVRPTGVPTTFQAGQFGYVPSFTQPPIVLPSNPGVRFAPPPVFTAGVTGSISRVPAVDCIVRRTDSASSGSAPSKQDDGTKAGSKTDSKAGSGGSEPPPPKAYCNRIAVPRASTQTTHHAAHRAWEHHVTVRTSHGQHQVRLPAQHVPGPGWYRIVTTEYLVLRFTSVAEDGTPVKHPEHVRRTMAVRSTTYVHVTRP